ncbi:MAG: HAD family hydrolase [Candidatus Izimaplasma sp.]|nr:HAD family hydrolase [Candidatus Izimaplasma bacterium]
MIKAVIFDLDGTLLDTIQDIANICNKVLEKNGYTKLPENNYNYYVGKGLDHLIRKLMEACNIEKYRFDDIKDDYHQIYKKESHKYTKIYPGISELLNRLKDNNISINVLSNKPHNQTVEVIKRFFNQDIFDYIYGKQDRVKAKPDPTLARELIKKLKVKSSEIIYVGDTKTDMQLAINAGLTSIGVLWGFRDETELVNAKASYIVKEPSEIFKIIEGKNNDSNKK